METELYSAIQALIALIERTDFTRKVSVSLDLGYSMLGYMLLAVTLALLLGYEIGAARGVKK